MYSRIYIILILSIIINGCESGNSISFKKEIAENIKQENNRIVQFAQYLEKNIDTSFYIQHRSKSNEYYYFYYEGDKISGSFKPKEEVVSFIKKEALRFKFREIWNSRNQNYLTFSIENGGKQVALILVLKRDQKTFNFPSEGTFVKLPILQSSENLEKEMKPFLFSVSNAIYIYFRAAYTGNATD